MEDFFCYLNEKYRFEGVEKAEDNYQKIKEMLQEIGRATSLKNTMAVLIKELDIFCDFKEQIDEPEETTAAKFGDDDEEEMD